MSQQTITLLFLVFTIISFILEKIPLGLTASICAIGLTLTGVVDVSTTFSQYVNSNVIPVSYTHLDVYKRQVHVSGETRYRRFQMLHFL